VTVAKHIDDVTRVLTEAAVMGKRDGWPPERAPAVTSIGADPRAIG
jgi:hypothetical protein